jgi:hypothetical protein
MYLSMGQGMLLMRMLWTVVFCHPLKIKMFAQRA